MPDINPPIARKQSKELIAHGHKRDDPYYWLNDRENAEVLDYLNRENEYYRQKTAHTQEFQRELFEEMKARIREDDFSVPYYYNGYFYLTRFETGKGYPIYVRKPSLEAADEILFDCNEMAKGHPYFQLGGFSISPDNKWAAFTTDTVGRRLYTLQVKLLETDAISPESIERTDGNAVWANDNKTIFYTLQDEVTLRPDRIYRHELGTLPVADELVYRETDDTFHLEVHKTKSRKYIVISSESTLTSESRILHADNPNGEFQVFHKRRRGHEYAIWHYGDHFYIRTNSANATNFKLMKTPEIATGKANWKTVIPHRRDVLLEDIEIFRDYLVLEERFNGLNHIRVMPWNGDTEHYLEFGSETYSVSTTSNVDFDTEILRFSYQSMATPSSVIDYNMRTREKTVLKQQEVLGGNFDKENYEERRIWAQARDGARIPMSVVYRKGIAMDGSNPLLLYAYGSYGVTIDAHFSSTRLSLLDRGFVYAIAHIRGGEDLGRDWYEGGKLLQKMNTFTDYTDCAKHLIGLKYTSPEHLYAEGGSAGGLLMGVVANEAPELFNGMIAQVPFVDVVTTMLDDSIPLTTGEYDEWGNPNDPEYYKYMLSYSPYDNVRRQRYPHLYVSTGLHDSQVQYWEPAKWVARLREMKTGEQLLFLDTNMDAGHGGASGRFEALKELAKEFSFFLDLEGIKK